MIPIVTHTKNAISPRVSNNNKASSKNNNQLHCWYTGVDNECFDMMWEQKDVLRRYQHKTNLPVKEQLSCFCMYYMGST